MRWCLVSGARHPLVAPCVQRRNCALPTFSRPVRALDSAPGVAQIWAPLLSTSLFCLLERVAERERRKKREKKQSKSLAGLLAAIGRSDIGPREQSDICLIGYGHLGSGKPDHAIKWLATSPLIHRNNAPDSFIAIHR